MEMVLAFHRRVAEANSQGHPVGCEVHCSVIAMEASSALQTAGSWSWSFISHKHRVYMVYPCQVHGR